MVRHVRISPKHLLIVLLLTVPLLSACDPSGPAEPGSASINVELHADGEAEVVVKFPPDRNGLSLSMIGTQVSNSIFPSAAAVTTRVDDQGGAGFPLARSRVVGAYSPGNRPHLILDFHRAVEVSSTGFDGGFQLPLSGLLEQGGASVLGFVLDGRDEADLAV